MGFARMPVCWFQQVCWLAEGKVNLAARKASRLPAPLKGVRWGSARRRLTTEVDVIQEMR